MIFSNQFFQSELTLNFRVSHTRLRLSIVVLRVVKSCSLVGDYRRIGATYPYDIIIIITN
jgi:hypothetical protein